jgi:hypothetical protein
MRLIRLALVMNIARFLRVPVDVRYTFFASGKKVAKLVPGDPA